MISDVLFDAVEEIERYQRNFPEVYGDIEQEIEEVKSAMRKLQRYLDTPPLEILAELKGDEIERWLESLNQSSARDSVD